MPLQLLEQTVGHRRAGKAELAHRRDIGLRETRVVQQVVIERRHQIEIADRSRRQSAPARVRHRNGAGTRTSPPISDIAMQRAHPHGVIERHHAERALAVAVEVLRDMGERGGAFGALAARHALGLARSCPRCRASPTSLGVRARCASGVPSSISSKVRSPAWSPTRCAQQLAPLRPARRRPKTSS